MEGGRQDSPRTRRATWSEDTAKTETTRQVLVAGGASGPAGLACIVGSESTLTGKTEGRRVNGVVVDGMVLDEGRLKEREREVAVTSMYLYDMRACGSMSGRR